MAKWVGPLKKVGQKIHLAPFLVGWQVKAGWLALSLPKPTKKSKNKEKLKKKLFKNIFKIKKINPPGPT